MGKLKEDFEKFISCNGDGSGSGDGYGSGYGSGDGSGYSYGSGYSSGYGDGDGSGYGYGYGYGSGYGDGDGSGSGDGSGYSSGYGDGDGSGDGYGYGDGSGYGSGYSSGYGYKIKKLHDKEIFYVDSLPCYPIGKINRIAFEIMLISTKDFSKKKCFLADFKGYIAHGETIRKALIDARGKYFSALDFGEVKRQLLGRFQKEETLTVKELFFWHGLLTGSCVFGRSEFQKEHDLKDSDKLTLKEFVKLTENSFGGQHIKELMR